MSIVRPAMVDAFRKLDPRRMVKNPVMFVVEVGSAQGTQFGRQRRSFQPQQFGRSALVALRLAKRIFQQLALQVADGLLEIQA